jgi:hypothetical protein
MPLLGYSILDLLAAVRPVGAAEWAESTGSYSRPYASERCADLHDFVLMESGRFTAISPQRPTSTLKCAFALQHAMPFAWMLKGSLRRSSSSRWSGSLRCIARSESTGVKKVFVDGGKACIELKNGERPDADFVVLAVHAGGLANLVMQGPQGRRVVDRIPELSELRRLRAERIPVVDLYFNRKLEGIPKEHVGLIWSDSDLTFLDISQLWTDDPDMRNRTALVLAASDFYALPSKTPDEDGYAMIHKLHEYLPVFDPGRHWGDVNSDICWEKTFFRTNVENKLFINEVGSGSYRPQTSYGAVPNLFFAGDFCKTNVDMATIEAAVASGLKAAQAVRQKHALGSPIAIAESDQYGDAAFIAMKLSLMPFAYWAKWWSIAFDAVPELSRGISAEG